MRVESLDRLLKQIAAIVVCIGILCAISWYDKQFNVDEPIVSYYTDYTDMNFKEISEKRANRYDIVCTDETDAKLYISTEVPSGFKKENYIEIGQTPTVMYVPEDLRAKIYKTENEHISLDTNTARESVATANIKNLLEQIAISNRENGVSGKNAFGIEDNNYYKLMIPEKDSIYRKMVVDTIILSLLDGKEATKENLEDIKETIYNVLENCYTSSTIKDTAIWGSDEFTVLGPECWAANFSIQGRTVIYIDKTSSTKINCYYKDGCEGLATTLYQSFNDSRLVGGFMIVKLKTVYEQTYIRLPNTIVSDWRYGKDYIKDLELDSNSISDVLGQSYWE